MKGEVTLNQTAIVREDGDNQADKGLESSKEELKMKEAQPATAKASPRITKVIGSNTEQFL